MITSAVQAALILQLLPVSGSQRASVIAAGGEERIVQRFYPEVTRVVPAPMFIGHSKLYDHCLIQKSRGAIGRRRIGNIGEQH